MRRSFGAVALATAFMAAQVFTGVGASHAAPPNGCPYPPNNPILSLRTNLRAGQVSATTKFSLGGYLTQNLCGIGFRRLGLFVRERPGPYTYHQTTATGFFGQFEYQFATDETVDLIVVFSGDRQFPRVVSQKVHVSVVNP